MLNYSDSLYTNEGGINTYVPRVPAGSSVTVACPGNLISNLGQSVVEAQCAGGTLLAIEGTVRMTEISKLFSKEQFFSLNAI